MLDILRGDPGIADWLVRLTAEDRRAVAPGAPVALPTAEELPEILGDLGVPYEDIGPLLAAHRSLAADPETVELLERAARSVVRAPGDVDAKAELPELPTALGELGRCFHIFVFLTARPAIRAHHRALGISEEVSRRTLADLGRHLAVTRRRTGATGLLVPWWIRLAFHGDLYQLGRLQFQRTRAGRRGAALAASGGLEVDPAELVLSLHIPDFLGPFTPAAIDRSLGLARAFFAAHFPAERYRGVVCDSWLLDPQLREHLAPTSNIVRFQDRFRISVSEEAEDRGPVHFVFGDIALDPAVLPRRSSLERAVGDHLRAGGHWYTGHGWFPY